MKTLMNLAVAGTFCGAMLLGGCATGQVDPADRDMTGAFDGEWIGTVGGPKSSRVSLPGKFYMSCDWEPFDIVLTIDDGMVQLGSLEEKTPVSTAGKFRIEVDSGEARISRGKASGSGNFVNVFTGNLAGGDSRGTHSQYITSIGTTGCTAPIRFRRTADTSG